MFGSEILSLKNNISDLLAEAEDLQTEVADALLSTEEDFDILDELAVEVYGLDSDLFENTNTTGEDIYDGLVSARDVVEGERDELYDIESQLEEVIASLGEADDSADYL